MLCPQGAPPRVIRRTGGSEAFGGFLMARASPARDPEGHARRRGVLADSLNASPAPGVAAAVPRTADGMLAQHSLMSGAFTLVTGVA